MGGNCRFADFHIYCEFCFCCIQQLLLCMTSVDAYIFRGVRQQSSHDGILGFIFRVMPDFVSGF